MRTDAKGRLVSHSPKATTMPLNLDLDPDELFDEDQIDEEEDNFEEEDEYTYDNEGAFEEPFKNVGGRKSNVKQPASKRGNSSKFQPPPM